MRSEWDHERDHEFRVARDLPPFAVRVLALEATEDGRKNQRVGGTDQDDPRCLCAGDLRDSLADAERCEPEYRRSEGLIGYALVRCPGDGAYRSWTPAICASDAAARYSIDTRNGEKRCSPG